MRTLLLALMLVACGGGAVPAAPDRCEPPAPPPGAFRDSVAPRLGSPRHRAADLIVPVGEPFAIHGKFSYGKVHKDLEDEDVGLVVGEGGCGPWADPVIRITDDNGEVRFEQPALERPAVRTFHLIVQGDGTRTAGMIWAIAPGTPAVLFDVDGTLTTGDSELFEDLLGDNAPNVRAGAADVARRWSELGYLVVYITGRPSGLRRSTMQWLDGHGFPRGPVLNPDEKSDIIPTRGHVGAYKRAEITRLIDAGLVFEAAYGNASTDVCAYAEAGIPPDRTWITQKREPCDAFAAPHDLPSYVDHLPTLADHPPASP